jgi:hypothetical protein
MTEDDTFKRHDFMSFKPDLLNTENIEHICATYYFGFHTFISREYTSESYDAILHLGQIAWSQPTSYAIRWKDISCDEYANDKARFDRIIQFMSEEINPIMGVSVHNPSASLFHHIASRDCGKVATERAKTPSFIQKADEYFSRGSSAQNSKTTGCAVALASLVLCFTLLCLVFVYTIFLQMDLLPN